MNDPISRRRFLSRIALSTLAIPALFLKSPTLLRAIEPIPRAGSARLSLSLAAYSFRDSLQPPKDPGGSVRHIDMLDFIDFCAEHGCQGTELTSYYFPTDFRDDYLLRLKHRAFVRGLAISGTAVGNTFTMADANKRAKEIAAVKKWIDHAQVLGAPHIRVFAGSAQGLEKSEARGYAVAALQECCDYAAGKGIMLGLENHGGIVAEPNDLLEIVHAVESPWFGVNLDTGNFQTDDPYADLARCAPYAVNVQIKTEIQRRGQKKEVADLERLVKILREARYQGYVALEYEAAEDPWQAVPRTLTELRKLFAA